MRALVVDDGQRLARSMRVGWEANDAEWVVTLDSEFEVLDRVGENSVGGT